MKYILGFFLFFTFTIFSQVELFNEKFQSGIPATWTIITNDANTPHSSVSQFNNAWIGVQDPDSLDTVAAATSYFNSPAKADRWLISPAITLGSFGNWLKWEAKSHDASFPDSYKVLILSSNTIASVIDTVELVLEENYLWEEHDVNLSSLGHNDETIYLAFVLTSYDSYILYIDDVSVRKEDPVGLAELSNVHVNFYPNPCNEQVKIVSDSKILKIELINALGTVVIQKLNTEKLDTRELPSSIYFLKVYTENGISTQKLVVSH